MTSLQPRRSSRVLLAFLVGSANAAHHHPHVPKANREIKRDWYSRYSVYPDYCSTPAQMARRSVPPLESDSAPRMPDTRIVHVTSVFRHGARTINIHTDTDKSGKHACWPGYWRDANQSVWDCDLTELTATPTPSRIREEEGGKMTESTAMLLFDKKFDALGKYSPDNPRVNILNGTCQASQMILQGYEQEIANGNMLREAYFHKGDVRMRLFERLDDAAMKPWDEHNLYLRSDDYQRTLMSGQLVLRGLFGPELMAEKVHPTVPVHLADLDRDVLGSHELVCPKLSALRARAESSQEFHAFWHSEESEAVKKYLEEHNMTGSSIVDCMMTSICTDRSLPPGLYGSQAGNWLHRIATFFILKNSFSLRYNDGEYAKLQSSVLWAEIMDHILPVVDENEEDRRRPPARLALYSAHDSTIMSLLPTLGSRVWDGKTKPPYASMMLIEIHEFVDGFIDKSVYPSQFGFRLIYNGQVLTPRMDGCPPKADLCDIKVLLDRVKPFATRSMDCTPPSDPQKPQPTVKATSKSILSKTEGILLVLAIIIVSACVGALVVFLHLTGRTLSETKDASNLSELDNDREGRVGLMRIDEDDEEIEMISANDASPPFDEDDADFLQ